MNVNGVKTTSKTELSGRRTTGLKIHKEYAEKLNIPVFVVIGVGGEPEKSEELFIVPLSKMKSNTITKSELANYKRYFRCTFLWDYEKNKLR